ncbi:cyclopropane-fatty-acyl-phospholipid synthase [Gloeopeniophorella convolvens]|nr:cyclopropane-fatty-acyl-phospholipid synthase [Gloeopeniophorella convolvens]
MSAQLLDTVHKHPSSLWSAADNALGFVREKVFTTSYGPVASLAEKAVVSTLRRITVGRLRIITDRCTYEFPENAEISEKDVQPQAELRVLNDAFWVRLCTMFDLGFSEAYMFGDVACDDLISVFLIFIRNKENLSSFNPTVSWLFNLPQRLTTYRFMNTLGNARSNISAHYDLSDDMFKAFLSKDMTYSSAIFADLDGDLRGETPLLKLSSEHVRELLTPSPTADAASPLSSAASSSPTASTQPTPTEGDTLADAQQRKLAHIATRARIRPGHRVLEIGSGWGALALHIVRTYPGAEVDSITLSENQRAYVEALATHHGVGDRVRVHLVDYREMPSAWDGLFDRVVSVEMVEAVGLENIPAYWAAIDRALKPREAAGVIQGITIPEARFDDYSKRLDFIQKWVSPFLVLFPGGLLPTVTLLVETMARTTRGALLVESIGNIGPHYARTLREWRRRFEARFADVERALRADHPGVFDGEQGQRELAVFRRKWIYYFCYCEVGFSTRTLGDHIITFTREGYEDMGCDVYE